MSEETATDTVEAKSRGCISTGWASKRALAIAAGKHPANSPKLEALLKLLEDSLQQVADGSLAAGRGNAVSSLANSYLRTLEASETEAKIARLEMLASDPRKDNRLALPPGRQPDEGEADEH